ncbi:unnamed protein product [Owenia fusiformis]|uniref:Uncharacterized protein n=1 Tax=Owenia fusiformis TaxID=6347 RepID=A0A8J1UIC3_OWEFU|nr:unnamed protein product [Owenia fusiformis]
MNGDLGYTHDDDVVPVAIERAQMNGDIQDDPPDEYEMEGARGRHRRAVRQHHNNRHLAQAYNEIVMSIQAQQDIRHFYHDFRHEVDLIDGARDLQQQARSNSERISIDGDILSYNCTDESNLVGVYIGAQPLSKENSYFEVEIIDTGASGTISVGLCPLRYPLTKQPGWNSDSVAYHGDDGKLFKSNGHGRPYGGKFQAGDRVGCGVKFEQMQVEHGKPRQMVPVFFTRNGKELGTVLMLMPPDGLYPAVGMHSEGEEVKLNLEAEWEHTDHISMSIDNYEEEWSRLHDVRLRGQVLEYTGRGKSIIDVGLAQARYALDTTNHYYEIEVIDPGENCYIAIGVARRDYPKYRHPGWNKGSVAYHADDGKLFLGSGIGEPFGPKCLKGDIMGCGILFPRDYNSEEDSDISPDVSPDAEDKIDELLNLESDYHSSDSEEEEDWWEKPNAETGTKVQVFFTRNGKTIGRREIRIPKGGFYPTVGMLSGDERVRVDLHPLTG